MKKGDVGVMRWWLRWILLILLAVLAWQFLRSGFLEQEREVRGQVREALTNSFPELANDAQSRFGIRRFGSPSPGRGEVLLLHGLDDPGLVWMNLVPALVEEGYGVLLLDYPNDQPIVDSARFLGRQLEILSQQGIREIRIVAHSMGGLVSRELLTSPELRCMPPSCKRPRVRQLIMVGTPNQGSDLARVRELGEVREQVSRLFTGEVGWLDWIFDGAGEAGIDLIPGSAFLEALNARALPDGVKMLVIAGEIGKPQWEQLEALLQEYVNGLPLPLREAREHLGDGLVSVDSARLVGVPLIRVPGNHLSIIRNVSATSTRIPPAIPIILQQLTSGEGDGEGATVQPLDN